MTVNTTVLVTRPLTQGQSLCHRLRQQGIEALHVPVMEIEPLDGFVPQLLPDNLVNYAAMIFVSLNAAEQAWAVLKDHPDTLRQLQIFTVGRTTGLWLQERDIAALWPEDRMDSEGLLALPELGAEKVSGNKVLIVRGVGGREFLAETLKQRGAIVDSCELYRRHRAEANAADLQRALGQADTVLVNSVESLQHLLALSGSQRDECLVKQLLVPSERVEMQARQAGFEHIISTGNATDDAVLATLRALGK